MTNGARQQLSRRLGGAGKKGRAGQQRQFADRGRRAGALFREVTLRGERIERPRDHTVGDLRGGRFDSPILEIAGV